MNEWRIRQGTSNDPNGRTWLDWKPGEYIIRCDIDFPGGGTVSVKYKQVVGKRSEDVVIIGWIDPAKVPLSTTGVSSSVLEQFPANGQITSLINSLNALQQLGIMAAMNCSGYIPRQSGTLGYLSSAERKYINNWLFKYSGNPEPPHAFPDKKSLVAYELASKHYKLFNEFQVEYVLDGTGFASDVFVLGSVHDTL